MHPKLNSHSASLTSLPPCIGGARAVVENVPIARQVEVGRKAVPDLAIPRAVNRIARQPYHGDV